MLNYQRVVETTEAVGWSFAQFVCVGVYSCPKHRGTLWPAKSHGKTKYETQNERDLKQS